MSTVISSRVDNTHRNVLKYIRFGYISNLEYRYKHQFDSSIGLKERQSLMNTIELGLYKLEPSDKSKIYNRGINLTYEYVSDKEIVRINFDTVSSIVTQNKDRKINNKLYLPFDKEMDKYNSIYVSAETNRNYTATKAVVDKLIQRLMANINLSNTQYCFKSMNTKNNIVV